MKRLLGPVVLILLASCSNYNNPTMPGQNPAAPPVAPMTTPCDNHPGGQDGPNGAPFVCIDYQHFDEPGYQPSPDPIQANSGVTVQFWFYNVGTQTPELDLQFSYDTPVHHQQCQGVRCGVTVKPNSPKIRRKYTIIDRMSGRHKDPDIFIEPAL